MTSQQNELVFGDKPKRKRRAVTVSPLVEEPSNEPKYKATDNDLPLIFWPEPDFDKETK